MKIDKNKVIQASMHGKGTTKDFLEQKLSYFTSKY